MIRIAQVMGKMVGGGVEAVVMNYYRHIDREKVQFDFLVDADSTLVPREEIEALGGRVIEIPPYQKVVDYHKTLVRVLRENQYQIVHSHINTLSVFPLFAARRAGIPVRIAHSHSTAGKGETVRNLMKYTLRPFSKVFATHYCACSRYAGEWLFGKKAIQQGKVQLLRNAIALERFLFNEEIRAEVRKELGLDAELVIGHVGRFMNQKNHKFLIEIFAELLKVEPHAVLLLVGEGELQDEIKALVQEKGIADQVRFLGQRSDVNRLYQAMDLLLFPSFYEGLSVVCVEAQAAGLPCLLSDAVSEETKLTECAHFFPLSAPAIHWAERVLELARENERGCMLEQMQQAGFEIGAAAVELESLYFNSLKS